MGKFLQFIKRNKKSATALCVIGALMVLVLYMTAPSMGALWPDDEYIKDETRELKKLQKKMGKVMEQQSALEKRRDDFLSQSADFWLPERDGKAEAVVHKKIEQAAKLSGLNLSSLGNLRTSKISEGILCMELSVSATASMESMTRFLAEIYRMSPRFYWDRCAIRPDNLRNPQNVILNGTAKFVCVNEKSAKNFLLGKKK